MYPFLKSHQYQRLDKVESPSLVQRIWQSGKIHIIYISLFLAFITSYKWYPSASGSQYGPEAFHLTTSPQTFDVDLSFALPPSKDVDAAWASLLPQGGGFFKHPTLAPKKSCVAVFHQLHCLDMLRQALYTASPALGGEPGHKSSHAHHEDENHEQSMYHIGHCFDLLRQTLMCRPDLTVEIGNETLGGVTGFGTEHQCVNWDSLMGWMAKYE